MSGLEGMDPLESKHRTRWPVNRAGQMILELGSPHHHQRLPEPNRSQCIALLGGMLLAAIKTKHEPQDQEQP